MTIYGADGALPTKPKIDQTVRWRCPDCGAGYPLVYPPHLSACPKRGLAQTLRNLASMYWRLANGRGCASYIRAQEWDRLRAIRRSRRKSLQ